MQRQQQQRSVLDFVLDDANDIQRQLSHRDRLRLDEYLTSFREIERRLAIADRFAACLKDPRMPEKVVHGLA